MQDRIEYAKKAWHWRLLEHLRSRDDIAEPGPIKELLEYLVNEETRHKEELEKLYYETVHSGGV